MYTHIIYTYIYIHIYSNIYKPATEVFDYLLRRPHTDLRETHQETEKGTAFSPETPSFNGTRLLFTNCVFFKPLHF